MVSSHALRLFLLVQLSNLPSCHFTHLAEKDVIVEMSKLGGKLAQLRAACRLRYLFLCHNIKCHCY